MVLAAAPSILSIPDCEGEDPPRRHFDQPLSVAVGPYGTSLPPNAFGFVVDDANRAIRTIDLDDKDLEQRLPTGRRLASPVPHTGAAGIVDTLWAVDRDSGEVVRFTLAEALDPTATAPVFDDQGAASDVEMTVSVVPGRTPTSTWTVTYRETLKRWEVRSAAGVDEELAQTDDGYRADEKAIRFEIRQGDGDAPPTEGDTFTFDTDNGLDVVAVTTTGKGVSIAGVSADKAVLATSSPASLVAFDLTSGLADAVFALPAGAIPGGMEVSADGAALWIADLGNPLVHRLNTAGAPATWTLESFPVSIPMRDLAVTGDGLRLFTLAADAEDVFVFALPDVRPVDLVGATPGADPLSLRTAIRSISGARQAHVMKGSGVPAYPILLTSHAGNVFFVNGSTGCVDYNDLRGPRLTGIRYRDAALTSNPSFDLDVFDVTSCGGFVTNENWTLTYNGLLDAWEVSGSVTGKQQGLMFENKVYTTDRGELTMRIVGDVELPTDDGDQFLFSVTDGVSPLQVGLLPDRPAFANVGSDAHEIAIVGNAASDTVAQFDVRRRRVTKTYR